MAGTPCVDIPVPFVYLHLGYNHAEITLHAEVLLSADLKAPELELMPQENTKARFCSIGLPALRKVGLTSLLSNLPRRLEVCLHKKGRRTTLQLSCTVDPNYQGDIEVTTPVFNDLKRKLLVDDCRQGFRPVHCSTQDTQST